MPTEPFESFPHVPYAKSVHGEDELEAVAEVIRTSTLMGARTRQFEDRIAEQFGKSYGVAVNSGTSALIIAVHLLDLPAGSEVITPVLTFATTVGSLVRCGHVPVFVDAAEATYNVDVERIERMIGPNTRAMLIPNLVGGLPDWDAIRAIAREHSLPVIEDSADTIGATLRGTPTGTRSDISTTSFYGSHIMNCAGNGGALCVDEPELARRAKLLRSWGRRSSLIPDDPEFLAQRFDATLDGIPYDAKFVFDEIGYNMEPSEVGSAFGLVQLDRLRDNIELRVAHFQAQLEFFKNYEEWFILPQQLPESYVAWLAFPLTVRESAPFTRNELQMFLEERNIQTRPVLAGNITRQPGFRSIPKRVDAAGYPVADRVTRGGILMACHHGLTPEMLAHVHESFEAFAERQ